MLASLFSKSQSSLSVQAKRLVAMRFLIYTGFQTSYFIGVIGTLTYADDASVVATSLAVLFMNVFVILGSFAGGAALDATRKREDEGLHHPWPADIEMDGEVRRRITRRWKEYGL